MGRAKKVVLAYSGGVDTSVCIPYLKQEWGVEEIITLAADLGQGDELEPVREKALKSGASESLVVDVKDIFVKDYAFPAIQANALYESHDGWRGLRNMAAKGRVEDVAHLYGHVAWLNSGPQDCKNVRGHLVRSDHRSLFETKLFTATISTQTKSFSNK